MNETVSELLQRHKKIKHFTNLLVTTHFLSLPISMAAVVATKKHPNPSNPWSICHSCQSYQCMQRLSDYPLWHNRVFLLILPMPPGKGPYSFSCYVAQWVRRGAHSWPSELTTNVGGWGFTSWPGRWIFSSNVQSWDNRYGLLDLKYQLINPLMWYRLVGRLSGFFLQVLRFASPASLRFLQNKHGFLIL